MKMVKVIYIKAIKKLWLLVRKKEVFFYEAKTAQSKVETKQSLCNNLSIKG